MHRQPQHRCKQLRQRRRQGLGQISWSWRRSVLATSRWGCPNWRADVDMSAVHDADPNATATTNRNLEVLTGLRCQCRVVARLRYKVGPDRPDQCEYSNHRANYGSCGAIHLVPVRSHRTARTFQGFTHRSSLVSVCSVGSISEMSLQITRGRKHPQGGRVLRLLDRNWLHSRTTTRCTPRKIKDLASWPVTRKIPPPSSPASAPPAPPMTRSPRKAPNESSRYCGASTHLPTILATSDIMPVAHLAARCHAPLP